MAWVFEVKYFKYTLFAFAALLSSFDYSDRSWPTGSRRLISLRFRVSFAFFAAFPRVLRGLKALPLN
jgi:hypothetical protein